MDRSQMDRKQLISAINRPDIMLVDVTMPGRAGPETVRGILLSSPATRIFALSAHEDEETMAEMLAAGALRYLVKATPPAQIVELISRSADWANAGSVTSSLHPVRARSRG